MESRQARCRRAVLGGREPSVCASVGVLIAGKGVVKERKILEIYIEKGAKNHHKVIFRGDADERPNEIPGDVVFVLEQQVSVCPSLFSFFLACLCNHAPELEGPKCNSIMCMYMYTCTWHVLVIISA